MRRRNFIKNIGIFGMGSMLLNDKNPFSSIIDQPIAKKPYILENVSLETYDDVVKFGLKQKRSGDYIYQFVISKSVGIYCYSFPKNKGIIASIPTNFQDKEFYRKYQKEATKLIRCFNTYPDYESRKFLSLTKNKEWKENSTTTRFLVEKIIKCDSDPNEFIKLIERSDELKTTRFKDIDTKTGSFSSVFINENNDRCEDVLIKIGRFDINNKTHEDFIREWDRFSFGGL